MNNEIVKNWFGEQFSTLAPELQKLHLDGGVLYGNIEVKLGGGFAGFIGKRLSRKLNIPKPGTSKLRVNISHDETYLHWDRQFNETVLMKSTFKPVNTIANGYWIEKTGSLEMMLTVDIKEQGWHWRCLGFKYRGLPIPVWLFPGMQAYKHIENGGYRFYVGFSAPVIGLLFSYSGVLEMVE